MNSNEVYFHIPTVNW